MSKDSTFFYPLFFLFFPLRIFVYSVFSCFSSIHFRFLFFFSSFLHLSCFILLFLFLLVFSFTFSSPLLCFISFFLFIFLVLCFLLIFIPCFISFFFFILFLSPFIIFVSASLLRPLFMVKILLSSTLSYLHFPISFLFPPSFLMSPLAFPLCTLSLVFIPLVFLFM